MGGIGSGRGFRWDKKATIESTRRIDILYLKKQGFLQAGCSGTISWNRHGKQTGVIGFRTFHDRLVLAYSYREGDGEWQAVEQTIMFTETACNYGKSRKWFSCPECCKRVGILSGYGKLFLCRHCYRLPNATCNESRFDRLITAREKVKRQAFDETGYRKRKHMHHKTFRRLSDRYWQLEWAADEYIESRLNGRKGLR